MKLYFYHREKAGVNSSGLVGEGVVIKGAVGLVAGDCSMFCFWAP